MDKFGAIIFGYPGIGKSTVGASYTNIIDLESSSFNVNDDGSKLDNWYKAYIQVAIKLAEDNHIVLLSTHPQTRDYLYELKSQNKFNLKTAIAFPTLNQKDVWVNKVYERYNSDPSEKNRKAYEKVLNDYEKDIKSLMIDNRFDHIYLDTDYDLLTSITIYVKCA